jgi:hypothetical protein
VVRLKTGDIFFLLLLYIFLLPSAFGLQANASLALENTGVEQKTNSSFQVNMTSTFLGGVQTTQFSALPNSLFTRHMMCKDYDEFYNPIDPTTIFAPSDAKAVCLTTVTVNNEIEFRWFYRSNSSKEWVSCYNWSERVVLSGENYYAGYLLIKGYAPGLVYPRAYRVDVCLDGYAAFSEFFEVTNGGLSSPRTCEEVDTNAQPVNVKSRFTIGIDTNVYHYFSFDNMAYFNEMFDSCHNFTSVWVQPNGSTYKIFSGRFAEDYKDDDITRNYWKHGYVTNDTITVNSSTSVGNWRVETYIDDYYLNGTWIPYGPVSVTPFVVGSGPVADWTFMVYLDGDNSLESAAIDTFLNMASVGSTPQVNIVVQMDRIGIDDRYDNWTDCKRFYITKGMIPTPENATLDLGEVNMGDPQTLKDFVNWTMNNYPANRYFLVLWDHGAGFMGFCFDVTSGGDALTLPELSQALSGLPSIIDVVLIDACSASMAEVAFQIKDYANIVIGPEDLGYEPAPYRDYLSSLTGNSTVSPNAFAVEVVTDYVRWCYSITNIQNATMSATDLTRTSSLVEAIDDYALRLKKIETPYHEQINLAKSLTAGCQGPYTGQSGYFIDLYDFVHLTSQYISDQELRDAASQLIAAIENTTIISLNKASPNFHGLSIFFPDENQEYKSYEDAYENTEFAADTLWNEFIKHDLSGCTLTIQTAEPYTPVEVDNESYVTDSQGNINVFVLPDYHNVSVTTPVLTGPASRSIFTQWNDADKSNPRTLFVNGTVTLSAEYETEYRLLISTNFGTTTPPVGEYWCRANTPFPITARPPDVTLGEEYQWQGWTLIGSANSSITENSTSLPMNEAVNVTAIWVHEYSLAVASSYGSPDPASGWYEAGTTITEQITSSVSGPIGTRYVCTGWIGNGSVSSSGASTATSFVLNGPSSVQWNWKTQYSLTIRTDPAGLNPEPNVTLEGPWYDSLTTVGCIAQQISQYDFRYWSANDESYDVGVNPINITMDAPYELVAHYAHAQAWWQVLGRSDVLQTLLAVLGIMITVSLVGGTWFKSRRRKDIVKTFLAEIDDVYHRLKLDPQKCEEELAKLRNTVLEGLTEGKITEDNYGIIDKRIDKYVKDIAKNKAHASQRHKDGNGDKSANE